MLDVFSLRFFWNAVAASLVLAGIHAYLGFHIVRRGVIFVDLALAQMAALGVAIAVMLNQHEDPVRSYLLSLSMTFVGAASFAWLRRHATRVPLEAYIGIIFASAQALVFLVLEKSPAGPEHLKETLVGTLYTISGRHVLEVAALYVVIGILHLAIRKPLFEITNDAEAAERRGRKVFFWDFVFYASFGFVVTSSVRIAGVLLVFGFLVIPAVAGLLTAKRSGAALAVGWIFGVLGALLGLLLSVNFDFPAAPSILVTLALMLALLGLTRRGWAR